MCCWVKIENTFFINIILFNLDTCTAYLNAFAITDHLRLLDSNNIFTF